MVLVTLPTDTFPHLSIIEILNRVPPMSGYFMITMLVRSVDWHLLNMKLFMKITSILVKYSSFKAKSVAKDLISLASSQELALDWNGMTKKDLCRKTEVY